MAVEPEEAAVLSGYPVGPHKIQGEWRRFFPEISTFQASALDSCPESLIGKSTTKSTACIPTRPSSWRGDSPVKRASFVVIKRHRLTLSGISSGANVVAAIRLASQPEMAGKLVVTLLPSFGERYL